MITRGSGGGGTLLANAVLSFFALFVSEKNAKMANHPYLWTVETEAIARALRNDIPHEVYQKFVCLQHELSSANTHACRNKTTVAVLSLNSTCPSMKVNDSSSGSLIPTRLVCSLELKSSSSSTAAETASPSGWWWDSSKQNEEEVFQGLLSFSNICQSNIHQEYMVTISIPMSEKPQQAHTIHSLELSKCRVMSEDNNYETDISNYHLFWKWSTLEDEYLVGSETIDLQQALIHEKQQHLFQLWSKYQTYHLYLLVSVVTCCISFLLHFTAAVCYTTASGPCTSTCLSHEKEAASASVEYRNVVCSKISSSSFSSPVSQIRKSEVLRDLLYCVFQLWFDSSFAVGILVQNVIRRRKTCENDVYDQKITSASQQHNGCLLSPPVLVDSNSISSSSSKNCTSTSIRSNELTPITGCSTPTMITE